MDMASAPVFRRVLGGKAPDESAEASTSGDDAGPLQRERQQPGYLLCWWM